MMYREEGAVREGRRWEDGMERGKPGRGKERGLGGRRSLARSFFSFSSTCNSERAGMIGKSLLWQKSTRG